MVVVVVHKPARGRALDLVSKFSTVHWFFYRWGGLYASLAVPTCASVFVAVSKERRGAYGLERAMGK